ncbi:hypothetical protein HYU09_02985 [Candidatus Woesearchaeota archaeon]|nr:hypothetical protein [Candidatus Woesearchaeota archaeon]
MLTKLEIKRQVIHALLGVMIVTLLYFDLIGSTVLFIVFVAGLMFSFMSRHHRIPVVDYFLKKFDREKDLEEFPGKGAIFYILGAFLAVMIFEKEIAMASILILAFGDSVSRLAGPYGYLKHPFHNEKFFEGVIAGAIAAFLGALIFIPWLPALLASSVSMLIEGIDLRIKGFKIDDNLTIPLVSCIIIYVTGIIIPF